MKNTTAFVRSYEFKHIASDFTAYFGNNEDGAIELVASPSNHPEHIFESAYYYGQGKAKPIVDISVMVGCVAKCNFCELGRNPYVRKLTSDEIFEQVVLILLRASQFSNIEQMHKVSLGKSGEPLLNPNTVCGLRKIGAFDFSFKVSTVFPRGNKAKNVFNEIMEFAVRYEQPVQLQVSLISTSEDYRTQATGIGASFAEIRQGLEQWIDSNPQPKGRKPNLSLILTKDTPADPRELRKVISPELANVRLRPYIETSNGVNVGLQLISEQRFADLVRQFKDCGYATSVAGIPTPIERKFRLSSNSTLERYRKQTQI